MKEPLAAALEQVTKTIREGIAARPQDLYPTTFVIGSDLVDAFAGWAGVAPQVLMDRMPDHVLGITPEGVIQPLNTMKWEGRAA